MYSNKDNINILTALLVKHGVRHAVVCPGSRNAAIVHNFNECPDIICHPVTDERSAAFVALGLRQQLDSPVAVCVTSGSALLNLTPAVAEATYRHQGIIVISADRPAAWIGQLDGQTMPQQSAFGEFAAVSVSLPEPCDTTSRWHCNRIINEALLENAGPMHPSVHINVPISEPLFIFDKSGLPDERAVRRIGRPEMKRMDELIQGSRTLVVIGQMSPHTIPASKVRLLSERMPVLTEPISTDSRSYTEQLMHLAADDKAGLKPDTVIYIGGNTVSKRLRNFLREDCADAYHIIVSPDGKLRDISCHTSLIIQAAPEDITGDICSLPIDTGYVRQWNETLRLIDERHGTYEPVYSQMLAVKHLEKLINMHDCVHYANSSAIRLGAVYSDHYCWCNRGLNGIEGSLSTAVGASIALASQKKDAKLFCIIGDLSFFYDQNALWAEGIGGNLRILLLNNGQGGIFKSLPGLGSSPIADTFAAGAHKAEAEGICKQFDIRYIRATDTVSLMEGINSLVFQQSERPVLLEVFTDAATDQQTYIQYFKHISHGMEENA